MKATIGFLPEGLFKGFHTADDEDMIFQIVLVSCVLAEGLEEVDEFDGGKVFGTVARGWGHFGETLETHYL